MQKIIPHLWYNTQAKEAAEFYTSVFPDSKITNVTTLHNTPSGDAHMVAFNIMNYSFMSISAGPLFTFTPAISFMVNFDPSRMENASTKIDEVWNALADGGKILMPLDTYPFAERYGWIEDKYGLSWQLMLTNPTGEDRPAIIPALMFIGDLTGKALEATDFYLSVFKNSKRGTIAHYPAGSAPDKESSVMFTDFMLEGQWFAAMDSGRMHDFTFTEAISLMVNCMDQTEIDYYWDQLSAVPESEQCGWLKDKYGVSWQIIPIDMQKMMANGTPEQIDRVTQAFLPMKKFDVAKLKSAFEGQ